MIWIVPPTGGAADAGVLQAHLIDGARTTYDLSKLGQIQFVAFGGIFRFRFLGIGGGLLRSHIISYP